MTSRRTLFMVSLAAAVGLHFLLYLAAPHIYLLKANSAMMELPEAFRVSLRDDISAPEPETAESIQDGLPRPESVRDLLRRETEMLVPEEMEPSRMEIPDQAERLAKDSASREHDLEYAPQTLIQMEARILEIGADAARRDIEVARRLVRPSGDRVLGAGDFPALRGPSQEGGGGGGIEFAPLPSSFAEGTGSQGGASASDTKEPGEETRPAFEADAFGAAASEPGLPALDIEEIIGQEPARLATREERGFEVLDDLVDIGVTTYIDPVTGDGFFKLEVSPKSNESIAVVPKEVTFVLDASSSIGQRKLDGAVEGLQECLHALRWEDRFNVIVFRDRARYFSEALLDATPENIEAAVDFIEGIEAKGSTDVYNAIRGIVLQPAGKGISNFVVLISDGRPTGNALAGRDLINRLTADNVHRRTIYTFGAGKSANRYLLDLLAYRNKGETFVSPRIDTLDDDLPRFFARIKDPVLVDLKADYGQVPRDQIFPREMPDFYRGRVVTVYGRFDPRSDSVVVMRLHGRAGAREKELVVRTDLRAADTGDPSIARDWAFQKSYDVIGQICEVGETPELLGELNYLSRTYGVRTSYSH